MEVIRFLQSFSSDFLNYVMIFITSFGSLYVLIALSAIIYWCCNKKIGYKMAVILSCSSVLNNFVKGFVQTPRPIGVDGISSFGEFTATGYSFPSGHAQNITTFGANLYIFTRKTSVFILSSLLIILVSISRLYLGLHWPTDIFGGIILALIVSILLNEVLVKLNKLKANLLIGAFILFFILGFFFIDWNDMGQDYYKTMGMFVGIYVGHLFEGRYVNFTPIASGVDNIMKLIIGGFTTALLYFLLSMGFSLITFEMIVPLMGILKYFILGFWIIGVVPLIFKLSNLYYKEAYEITNVKYKK